jgi:TRAP-type uncharacterized transport system fused permease subunit
MEFLQKKIWGKNLTAWMVSVTAVLMSLFHLYTAGYRPFTPWLQRSYHLMFALILVFLLYPTSKKGKPLGRVFDLILGLLGMSTTLYLAFNLDAIINRAGRWNEIDVMFGIILTLLVLEATRRVTGNALPIVASVFLIYGRFGNYIPGLFSHRGYSVERLSTQLYLTLEGIFGVPWGFPLPMFFSSSSSGHFWRNPAWVSSLSTWLIPLPGGR